MNVIEGSFGPRACGNLAQDLRDLADAVDRGEIIELVAAYVQGNEHAMLYSASLSQSVFLSTLLQRNAVDRCIVGAA